MTFAVTAVGAILCAVMDLLIAACLGMKFFKLKTNHSSTPSLMRRIFVLSITSGAIVASTTLLMMILFLTGNIAFEFFFSCQGRVYALTLLVNFLSGPSSMENESPQSSLVFRADAYPTVGGPGKPASIYSNFSEDSLSKELPPLPNSAIPQLASLRFAPPQLASFPVRSDQGPQSVPSPSMPRFAPAQSVSSPSSVGPQSVSSPQTPQAPRTPRLFIAAPYRVDSLPQDV
ncbi:hypothetical protein B0H17DRAFT_1052730 [Mycena rosella]|uniref:DUF6534 domain-containing protein n=1 Tax=Mycena rosella TaxID=1033263 RepID=A0AAD7DQ92_MYCRO|nr:hypothetical protein B0H17DRAFT_1052730 [Mycena rosella]